MENLEKAEKNGTRTGKDPITGKFIAGNNFGTGRTPGALDFKTKWLTFIDWIAKQKKVKPEDIDNDIFEVALKKMKNGSFPFFKDIHDRVYGQPKQAMDITTDGEKIYLWGENSKK